MESTKASLLELIENEMNRRQRLSPSVRIDDTEPESVESSSARGNVASIVVPSREGSCPPEDRDIPKGFICPLTMDVMYDPVLDQEGNTYERSAIIEWLCRKRNSPVSRQPLNDKMLIPNNALRETIHEHMGIGWSGRQKREHPAGLPLRGLSFRAKIDCYLQSISQEISGINLCLNDQGHCIFQCDGISIVLFVPESVGVFCFYARHLVPAATDSVKDLILDLNFLQGETRGGCLATTRNLDGRTEVVFSYSDRIPEVNADDFRTVFNNFVETAASLRNKLLIPIPQPCMCASPARKRMRHESQAPPQG